MTNNSEKQSFFKGLKSLFSKSNKIAANGRPIECIRFVDYPVFAIDGKEYSVDLEDSQMMKEVYQYLDSLDEKTEAEFTLVQKRSYAVPSIGKYLALTISLDCESVDDGSKISCVVTHMGIENAVLVDKADKVEPEAVKELH